MESLIPLYRMIHFVGFAMLLGGTLSSIIAVNKEQHKAQGITFAWYCMHYVASPGLVLLLLTGLLQSMAMSFLNFKGAGYMHLKATLAVMVLVLMFADMKTQKRVIKERVPGDILAMVKKRQCFAAIICLLVLAIMALVGYRPF